MDVKIHLDTAIQNKTIAITGSKSETNRLLLLEALYPGITIVNKSVSDDSAVMQNALAGNQDIIDIHHAGTAMRFLTAYYSLQDGKTVTLTGSSRMKQRPIGKLVNALRTLGAKIDYLEGEGYPPLKITGTILSKSSVTITADTSSQYITALLLIAGRLQNGLELTLEGEITSLPYIQMTLSLLASVGVNYTFTGNTITVKPVANLQSNLITIESDWSSASYYYSVIALSPRGTKVTLSSFKENSRQGDSELVTIYKAFGVETDFLKDTIVLTKGHNPQLQTINISLNNTPDIAQTIAVTCLGLGISCNLSGLHTLKIKETDRLEALKTELEKFGATVTITDDSISLVAHSLFEDSNIDFLPFKEVAVNTYNDHRMAMAFAPLAVKIPLVIKDADVVSKSYPEFWADLHSLGFSVQKQ